MYKYVTLFLSIRHYSFLYKATAENCDIKAKHFHLPLLKQNTFYSCFFCALIYLTGCMSQTTLSQQLRNSEETAKVSVPLPLFCGLDHGFNCGIILLWQQQCTVQKYTVEKQCQIFKIWFNHVDSPQIRQKHILFETYKFQNVKVHMLTSSWRTLTCWYFFIVCSLGKYNLCIIIWSCVVKWTLNLLILDLADMISMFIILVSHVSMLRFANLFYLMIQVWNQTSNSVIVYLCTVVFWAEC